MTDKTTQNGPPEMVAFYNETIAPQLAKLKAYANEHIPDFYDALYAPETIGDPKIETLRMEQFRTLVDSVRPLINQLPLGKLISELAATDAFRLGVDGFEHYLANEIMLLGTVGALFHAANKVQSFPN